MFFQENYTILFKTLGIDSGKFNISINDLDVEFQQGISSHGIGILPILKYAEESSYNLPKKIEIFGIQIKETTIFSEELTPEVKEGVEKLTILLKEYILNLLD